MADNRKYYNTMLKNAKAKIHETDFMITKITEAQLLVKYGFMSQAELTELEQKYIAAIKDKKVLRERVRSIETSLQAEIKKYEESLTEK